jgi:hypothetical protein
VSCFPSFACGKNRLHKTALRSLLLAGANCRHKVSCFPSFACGENRLRKTALRSLLLAGANCRHEVIHELRHSPVASLPTAKPQQAHCLLFPSFANAIMVSLI